MRQMVIKHLGIQNFKSLSQCRIDGLWRITPLCSRFIGWIQDLRPDEKELHDNNAN